ncbi:MAG: division/cell wall cluster transcriptional repressor MraZ [Bacteroidota bacterium]
MFCTGTFERNLDDKQRLLVPKAVKKTLDSNQFFITPGCDNCLELHNEQSIRERAREAEQSPAASRDRKSFARLFFAQAESCELDSQNRIRLPQRLIDWAGLESRLVILGVGANWEIWNEGNWHSFCKTNKSTFDDLALSVDREADCDRNANTSTQTVEQISTEASPPKIPR